jgi:FKBP-type peptidyl-prolyl cis-trans isomerase FklB
MKPYLQPLLTLLTALTLFASCEETKTESRYDNWQQRNNLYIDSLRTLTGNSFVSTAAQAEAIPVGKLFAIPDVEANTTQNQYFVYAKKISPDNPAGTRPFYTSSVTVYYYGTFIDGTSFDGNFNGYSATDRTTLSATDADKAPTPYDNPVTFTVGNVISGWKAALQLMRTGERWMLYIPCQSAYGTDDYTAQSGGSTIPGYSVLGFDVVLDSLPE